MGTAIQGTTVISPIRPANTDDTYPTAYANELLGGYQTRNTKADRNSIPLARRTLGMKCMCLDDKITYTLINNPTTATTQDSDWSSDNIVADNITLSNDDTTTIKQAITDTTTIASSKYIHFSLATNSINGNEDEFVCPFNASINSLSINIPISSILTSNVSANLEKYNGTSWVILETLSIPISSASKVATLSISPVIYLNSGDRIRINVTTIQNDITVLNADISIVLTK
jgi:hypothetical protein